MTHHMQIMMVAGIAESDTWLDPVSVLHTNIMHELATIIGRTSQMLTSRTLDIIAHRIL